MTKYILHGGATGNKTDSNKKFFSEATSGLPDGATILCVYFARDKELWPKMLEQDKLSFLSNSHGALNFLLANNKTHTLAEQMKEADMIYLRGGEIRTLEEALNKGEDLKESLKGKTVVASSAGANVLSKYYYSNSRDGIYNGLGILPIKTFCHYTDEKHDKLEKLKKYGEDTAVYAIPEEKFFIIEQ